MSSNAIAVAQSSNGWIKHSNGRHNAFSFQQYHSLGRQSTCFYRILQILFVEDLYSFLSKFYLWDNAAIVICIVAIKEHAEVNREIGDALIYIYSLVVT